MESLDIIKSSLDSNPHLDDEIKNKLFELSIILNKKMPNVDLSKLNEKLKTVKIGRISRFEKKGVYFYDVYNNEIQFSSDKLKKDYDLNNIFMKAVLSMATSANGYTGFNSDERLKTLNMAYTEILANFLVGNEEESDLEEEMLVTNLLSHIVGKDTMFNAYFTNDGDPIIRAMQEAEVGLI